MDMVAIMYRRLRKGMSPFSPDRQHIHHLIMRAGFTSRQAFVLITWRPLFWPGLVWLRNILIYS
jgi:UDP-GlcNAc:undecaprenyl-phosphate GlcNAc-1-phosphate transferase